jgi:hypothetical protein
MTQPALRLPIDPEMLGAELVLGPATVTSEGDHRVEVRVAGEPASRPARLALAVPYRPSEGDEVLVLGKGRELYVVGVLTGSGLTALEIPGDVSLRAVGGTLRLEGDRGVEVRGAEVRIEARTLAVVAEKALEKVDELYQRVRGMLSVHVGRSLTTVDQSATTTARSSQLLVEETATINGKQIHLG